MATYGYTRLSRHLEASESKKSSLQAQQRMLNGYAMMQGMTIARIFVDDQPGCGRIPLAERPQGGTLLSALRPGDTVLVARLDRMFRSALDAVETAKALKDNNVSLHMLDMGGAVDSNPNTKMVFVVLAAVAEFERDLESERLAESAAIAAA